MSLLRSSSSPSTLIVPSFRGRDLLQRQGHSHGGDGGSLQYFILKSRGLSRWGGSSSVTRLPFQKDLFFFLSDSLAMRFSYWSPSNLQPDSLIFHVWLFFSCASVQSLYRSWLSPFLYYIGLIPKPRQKTFHISIISSCFLSNWGGEAGCLSCLEPIREVLFWTRTVLFCLKLG